MRSKPSLHCYAIVMCLLTLPASQMWGDAGNSFRIGWGDRPEQLGILQGEEMERVGPLTFAVAPDGEIYVADSVHRQVKRWQSDGTFAGVVLENVRPNAISFTENGALLLLTGYKIQVFTRGGQQLAEVTVPAPVPLVEGYGQDVWEEEGHICVNDPDERTYCFNPTDSTPTTAGAMMVGRQAGKGERVLVAGGERGAHAHKLTVPEEWTRVHLDKFTPPKVACFFDPKAVRRQSPARGGLLFKGVWEKPRRYVFEMEEVGDRDVKLMIVSTSDGKSFARLELPNSYYTTVYKKTEVMANGDLWQMVTTPDGVEFVRWRAPQ